MRQNQLKNVTYLKSSRKELRNNLTPAEAALWNMLKGSGLKDKKFRRQHSIGNYIVDFYCPEERLIIELDGQIHNDPIQSLYDADRSRYLEDLGNRILRFENKLIFTNPVELLDEIASHFRK